MFCVSVNRPSLRPFTENDTDLISWQEAKANHSTMADLKQRVTAAKGSVASLIMKEKWREIQRVKRQMEKLHGMNRLV